MPIMSELLHEEDTSREPGTPESHEVDASSSQKPRDTPRCPRL